MLVWKMNMKVVYTKHVEKKLKSFKALGVIIRKSNIEKTVRNPIHIDKVSDYPKIIASGELDKNHIIRVVYKVENDIITVITCYPTQKGRYFI